MKSRELGSAQKQRSERCCRLQTVGDTDVVFRSARLFRRVWKAYPTRNRPVRLEPLGIDHGQGEGFDDRLGGDRRLVVPGQL